MSDGHRSDEVERLATRAVAARIPGQTRASRYDAFISYSHSLDGRLAPALQVALHRFAKPWHRLRALRVFRDDASLSANPALWQSLEAALGQSEWLILLASRNAANSGWVATEVEFWCKHRAPEQMIIVLTDGEILWDSSGADFDWSRTTALPTSARGAFAEEPRFVDLRWARADTDVSLANPRFVEAVADIAATVHRRPKDELIGDDVRQHHRTKRVIAATIATLSILLVGAIAASTVAVQERNRAQSQTRAAVSRLLASTAINTHDAQLDFAFRLAAQGWAYQDNAQTRAGLVQTLLRSPHLLGFLPDTRDATALSYASAADALVVGTNSGVVTQWDGTTHKRTRSFLPIHNSPVSSLAVDIAGAFIVSGHADGTVQVWNSSGGDLARRWTLSSPIMSVAFGRDGSKVLAATENGELHVWSLSDGRSVYRVTEVSFANPRLDLAADDMLTVGDGQGDVSRWNLRTGDRPVEKRSIGAGQPLVAAYTRDLRFYAGQTNGNPPYVVDVSTGSFLHPDNLPGPETVSDVMVFSPSGDYLATTGNGRLQFWDVRRNTARSLAMAGVLGAATSMAFGRSDAVIAVASKGGVGLWDLHSRVLEVPLSPRGAQPSSEVPSVLWGAASVAFSHDGARVAWSINTSGQSWVVVWDVIRRVELLRVEAEWVLGFSPDDSEIRSSTDLGKSTVVSSIATGASRATTPSTPNFPPESAQVQPWTVASTQGVGASIDQSGTLTLWDVPSGQPVASVSVPGGSRGARLAFDPAGRRLAISPPGGLLTLIDTDVASWNAKVCERAGGPLSLAEWSKFVGDRLTGAPRACSANGTR